ncbi:MAG: type II toxin-antitoxin system ParD family antitoxin [Candidatus Methanoperedens sp.]|nr:type II toxin-antitoxin system ParD family antitoxin [Candidatus Methanoperedens sp.]
MSYKCLTHVIHESYSRHAYACKLHPTGRNHMKRVTLRLPEQQLKMIDMLVEYGEFPSASEAIRTAIRDLIDQRSDKLVGRMKLFETAQEQAKNADSFLRLKEKL